MKKTTFFLFVFLVIAVSLHFQNLKRRAYLGIKVSALAETQKADYKISKGIFIDELIDEELSSIHKLQKGDILLKINDKTIDSVHYLFSEMLKYR